MYNCVKDKNLGKNENFYLIIFFGGGIENLRGIEMICLNILN